MQYLVNKYSKHSLLKTAKQIAVFCLFLCVLVTQSYADETPVASEDKLKAIYLVNISKLTTWPEGRKTGDDFFICIDESTKITARLTEILGYEIHKKALKLQHDLTAQKLMDCDAYYVSPADYPVFKQLKSQLEDHGVLTVSSEEDFTEDDGGVIGYYIEDKKVKMRVNLQTMRRSRLAISSKLLRLMDTEH